MREKEREMRIKSFHFKSYTFLLHFGKIFEVSLISPSPSSILTGSLLVNV